MNEICVTKRYGQDELDVREFIRPHTLMVRRLMRQLSGLTERQLWAWVVQHIQYPWGNSLEEDFHQEARYVTRDGRFRFVNQTRDFWNYPSETLRDREGDCDDSAILLTSMLRYKLSANDVFCTIGTYATYGHMWVSVKRPWGWEVFETTMPRMLGKNQYIREEGPYKPIIRFNDQLAFRVGAGAIPETVRDPRKRAAILKSFGTNAFAF